MIKSVFYLLIISFMIITNVLKAQTIIGPQDVCESATDVLFHVSPSSNVNHQWSIQSGSIVQGQGNDSIYVSFSSLDDTICVVINTVITICRPVNVMPGTANIDAGLDVTIEVGETTQLIALGASSYIWTPALGLSCTDCSNPIANPTATTTYYVTSSSATSCTQGDSVTVFVDIPNNLFVPSIFTPNGDGNNDEWFIAGESVEEVIIGVFNRWGEKVYSSTDINNVWDGYYSGLPVEIGVYFYQIEYRLFGDDFFRIRSGNITVIR